MLLGIYGMFADGKSTFMLNNMDSWADAALPLLESGIYAGLTVVIADQCNEYTYNMARDSWKQRHREDGRWNGKRDVKILKLPQLISSNHLYVVESARYFGGLHDEILDAVRMVGGGLRFVIPWTDENTGRRFLIDRCDRRGKTFRADYWTTSRLEYECRDRYVNVANKRYVPFGIETYERQISYDRQEWADVNDVIIKWIVSGNWKLRRGATALEPKRKEVQNETGASAGQQRIGQDNHRQRIDRSKLRHN